MDSAAVSALYNTATTAVAPIALAGEATSSLLKTLTAQIEIKEQLSRSAVSYVTSGMPHGVKFTHNEITRDSMAVESALRSYHFNLLRETLDLEHSSTRILALGFKGRELQYFSAFKTVTHMTTRTLDTVEFVSSPAGKAIKRAKRFYFHDSPEQIAVAGIKAHKNMVGVISPEWAMKLGISGVLRLMGKLGLERMYTYLPLPFELLYSCSKVEHYMYDTHKLNGDMATYLSFVQANDAIPEWALGKRVKGNFVPNCPCTMPAWYRFWQNGAYEVARLTALAEGVASNVRYEALKALWKQWLMAFPGLAAANRLNRRGSIYSVRGTAMASHWSSFKIDFMPIDTAYSKCNLVLPSYRRCYLARNFATGYRSSGRAARKHINIFDVDDFVAVPMSVTDELRQYLSRNTDKTFEDPSDALALVHTAMRKTISTLVIAANQVSTVGPTMSTEEMRSLAIALVVENYIMRARANKIIAHNMNPTSLKSAIEKFAEVFIDSNWFGTFIADAIYGKHQAPVEIIKPAPWIHEFEMRVFISNVFTPISLYDASAGCEDPNAALEFAEEESSDDESDTDDEDDDDSMGDVPQLAEIDADDVSVQSDARDDTSELSSSSSGELLAPDEGKDGDGVLESSALASDTASECSASSGQSDTRPPAWARKYIKTTPKKFAAKWVPKQSAVVLSTRAGDRVITEAVQHIELEAVGNVQTTWGPDEMRVYERPSGGVRPHPMNETQAAEAMRKTLPPGVKKSHWTLAHTLAHCKCRHHPDFPPLCAIAYRLTGTYMHCDGRPPKELLFSLTEGNVAAIVALLQKSQIAADPLLAKVFVRNCVPNVGIRHKAKVAFVEAPPGCGKTHLITTLVKELAYRGVSYHVCVPLSELAGEYGTVNIPSVEDTCTALISKGTQLYWAVKSYNVAKGDVEMRAGVKVLIVDEAWLAAGEHLTLAVAHLKPELVYIVGDSYQNEMPSSMVVKSFSSLVGKSAFQAGKTDHSIHRLVFNFRNPPAIVDLMNKHYYAHSPMVAMSKKPGLIRACVYPDGDEAYSPYIKDAAGDPVPYYCMYPSNYTGAKMASKATADIAVKNTGNTVLASQGLTRPCVKVYLTERDAAAYKQPELMRVMLSRHTEELVFVLDKNNSAAAMQFLSGLGIHVELRNRVQNQKPPQTAFVVTKEVLPEKPAREKLPKSAFGAGEILLNPVLAGEAPHVNDDERFNPLNATVKRYEQEPDAMKVDCEEDTYVDRVQLSYVPHALMQTNSAVEAQRTALSRYNSAHSKIHLDSGTPSAVENLAKSVFSKTKNLAKLKAFWEDSELHHSMWNAYLQDNRERKTFNKADGMSDVDDYLIFGAEGQFLPQLFTKIVFMSQKAGIKMVNNTKEFSADKVGQGVSQFSPMLTLTFGFLMRLMNRADMLSNRDAADNLQGPEPEWTIVEHNGRNPEDVAADLAAVVGRRVDLPQVAVTDVPKADSSISEADYMLSLAWDLLLLQHCRTYPVEIVGCLHLFYGTLPRNEVVVPTQIRFRSESENMSGHSATLMVTTRVNKCNVVQAMHKSQGPKVASMVGDDGLGIATVLIWDMDDPVLAAYRKYSHVRFSVTDARAYACDFVGHVILLEKNKFIMVPSLIRRFERVVSRPWRNAAEFLGTKQAILDYFADYSDRHDDIITVSANILADRHGLNSDVCDMTPFRQMAQIYWDAYEAMSHWSAADFDRLAKPVKVRVA
jgi:hypothetical protein